MAYTVVASLPKTGTIGQKVTFNGYNYQWIGTGWKNVGVASVVVGNTVIGSNTITSNNNKRYSGTPLNEI